MDADAGRGRAIWILRRAVDGAGGVDVDAELVFAEAGGDVRVGFGEDVGVDAEGEAGAELRASARAARRSSSASDLDVEEEDVGAEGGVDLPDLLPTPEKTTLFERGLVGFADTLEFSAGDDVEACALFGEEAEDGERGVGFDGVADGVGAGFGAAREGLLEELEALGDLLGGVDVEGRAVFSGEAGKVDSVTVEGAVAIDKGAR